MSSQHSHADKCRTCFCYNLPTLSLSPTLVFRFSTLGAVYHRHQHHQRLDATIPKQTADVSTGLEDQRTRTALGHPIYTHELNGHNYSTLYKRIRAPERSRASAQKESLSGRWPRVRMCEFHIENMEYGLGQTGRELATHTHTHFGRRNNAAVDCK